MNPRERYLAAAERAALRAQRVSALYSADARSYDTEATSPFVMTASQRQERSRDAAAEAREATVLYRQMLDDVEELTRIPANPQYDYPNVIDEMIEEMGCDGDCDVCEALALVETQGAHTYRVERIDGDLVKGSLRCVDHNSAGCPVVNWFQFSTPGVKHLVGLAIDIPVAVVYDRDGSESLSLINADTVTPPTWDE